MAECYSQGAILKASGISNTFLIVSKNVYNETGQVIACPLQKGCFVSALTYVLKERGESVICDQLHHLDLSSREVRQIGEISINDIVEISNIVESLFDYY